MGADCAVKSVAVFSALFGAVTLLTCGWTFGSMVVFQNDPAFHQQSSMIMANSEDKSKVPKLWACLGKLTQGFRIVMYASIWIAILFLIAQIGASLLIFFMKNLKVWHISIHFVGIHFLVFLVLILCLSVPLAFESKRDQEFITFNDYIKREFSNFGKDSLNYIVQDFHAYYFAIGADIIVIFTSIISACCLLRCKTGEHYDAF